MAVVKPARAVPLFASVDDVSDVTSIDSAQCLATCTFDPEAPWHHRKLITIESDQSAVLDLMELAITWPELEYSDTPTIAPAQWISFVESHRWLDSGRVERIFSVATDIAMTAMRASKRPLQSSDCPFGQTADSPAVAISTIPGAGRDQADLGQGVVSLDRSTIAALIVDHRGSGSGDAVELAEGWSGRRVARRGR
jgi:hypothetical protein